MFSYKFNLSFSFLDISLNEIICLLICTRLLSYLHYISFSVTQSFLNSLFTVFLTEMNKISSFLHIAIAQLLFIQ